MSDPLFRRMLEKLCSYGEVNNVGIEIDEPASSMIYRVPPSIRNVDPSAYEPEVVSIGPYHRNNPKLHAMEDHKWRYTRNLLRRRRRRSSTDQIDSADEMLKRCIDKVKQSEARARRCYEVPNFSSMIINYDDFVMALVLNGCFILELFFTSFYEEKAEDDLIQKKAEDDLIHAIPWMFRPIWRDLIKLENQIPFFILQDLFTASNVADICGVRISLSLEILAFWYLKNGSLSLAGPIKEKEKPSSSWHDRIMIMTGGNKIYHLLHFYHMLLRPDTTSSTTCDDEDDAAAAGTTPAGNINNNNDLQPRGYRSCSSAILSCMFVFEKVMKKKINFMPLNIIRRRSVVDDGRRPDTMIPCVAELCDAGITVTWRQPEKEEEEEAAAAICAVQLDVAFEDGVLHVPRLTVVDSTNTVFRNLLALEQFCPNNWQYVTSYTTFLDCIVNTAKDVTILQQRGVINNMLGSEDEVAQVINRLGKDVILFDKYNYLKRVFREVNDYCGSKWHKYRAACMRDYFGTPWSAISLFAAVALLLMTLIQVVFAILSYKKQGINDIVRNN